jgi:hypothetical protein
VSITVSLTPGSIEQTVSTCAAVQAGWNLAGRISASQPVTVTYQWARSDGTSTQPATVRVAPGADASLPYTAWEPGTTTTYHFTETLLVTSPGRVSASTSVSYTCQNPPLRIGGSGPPGLLGPLPNANVDVPYNARVTATGGDGIYHWSATGLPPGLSLDPATGVISGTIPAQPPAVPGQPVSTVQPVYGIYFTVVDGESPPQQLTQPLDIAVYLDGQQAL